MHSPRTHSARDLGPAVRINISVPGSVRKQMDAFTETTEVNWSKVAAQAFTRHMRAHARLARWRVAADRRRLAEMLEAERRRIEQEAVFSQGG